MPVRTISKPFLDLALVLVLAAAAGPACAANRSSEPFRLIGMDEVQRMLSEPDVVVIDANPKDVFDRNHLPGARYYKSAPFAQVLPADKTARLVFYCASPS